MTEPIKRCCGARCYFSFGGPHWGDVDIVSDEWDGPVHACEAHMGTYSGSAGDVYTHPPEGCLTIRDDDEEMKDE